MRRRLGEVQVATMLLTRLPAGRVVGEVPTPAAASWAFPLVGVVVGGLAWVVFAAATAIGLGAPIAAVLSVATMIAVTGALHEDALADVADGFGGGRDTASKLEIMRDSRVGSYGVAALIVALLLKVLAIAEAGGGLAAFIATAAVSRCAMLVAMHLLPPARSDGLGRSAASPGLARIGAAAAIGIICIWPLGGSALAAVAATALAGLCVGRLSLRQIGGQTGDVLGTIQMVGEIAAWLAIAALAPHPGLAVSR